MVTAVTIITCFFLVLRFMVAVAELEDESGEAS